MHQTKEFCKEYKRKLELDKDIKENPNPYDSPLLDYRDRITFRVVCTSHAPGYRLLTYPGYVGIPVIELDEEDLRYLYNKYKK